MVLRDHFKAFFLQLHSFTKCGCISAFSWDVCSGYKQLFCPYQEQFVHWQLFVAFMKGETVAAETMGAKWRLPDQCLQISCSVVGLWACESSTSAKALAVFSLVLLHDHRKLSLYYTHMLCPEHAAQETKDFCIELDSWGKATPWATWHAEPSKKNSAISWMRSNTFNNDCKLF